MVIQYLPKHLFPNPFSDFLKMTTTSTIKSVRIYNSNGIVIANQLANFDNLNVTSMETGLYFLEIIFANGHRIINKIIKEK